MNEELLDELLVLKQPIGRQHELIANACRGIEDRIASASSAAEAEQVVQEACSVFERECPSEIIRRQLLNHVRSFYEHHWGLHK